MPKYEDLKGELLKQAKNDTISIDIEKVREVARGIDSKREEMHNTYASKVQPLLKSIEECLTVSGVSYDEIISSFDGVFNGLDKNLSNLYSALNDKIIPQYEESMSVVTRIFNNDFASELRSVLSRMNSGRFTSGGTIASDK